MNERDILKGVREGWLAPEESDFDDDDPTRMIRVVDRWFVFTRTRVRVRVLGQKGLPVT